MHFAFQLISLRFPVLYYQVFMELMLKLVLKSPYYLQYLTTLALQIGNSWKHIEDKLRLDTSHII